MDTDKYKEIEKQIAKLEKEKKEFTDLYWSILKKKRTPLQKILKKLGISHRKYNHLIDQEINKKIYEIKEKEEEKIKIKKMLKGKRGD